MCGVFHSRYAIKFADPASWAYIVIEFDLRDDRSQVRLSFILNMLNKHTFSSTFFLRLSGAWSVIFVLNILM